MRLRLVDTFDFVIGFFPSERIVIMHTYVENTHVENFHLKFYMLHSHYFFFHFNLLGWAQEKTTPTLRRQ